MPYTSELHWTDTTHRELQNNLRTNESRLLETEKAHDDIEAEGAYIEPLIAKLEEFAREAANDGQPRTQRYLATAIYGLRAAYRRDAEDIANRISTLRSQVANFRARARRYPANYDDRRSITKAGLKQILKNVDGVDPGSVTLSEKPSGDKIIRWVYPNLVMSPDKLTTAISNMNLAGLSSPSDTPLRIPLPGLAVIASLTNRRIKVHALRSQAYAKRFRWAGDQTPHPHILDDSTPCLGDFGGPVTEALNAGDWETLAVTLRMFFETCVTEDGAGRQWTDYVSKRIRTHIRMLYPHCFAEITNAADARFCYLIEAESTMIRPTVNTDGDIELLAGEIPSRYEMPTEWGPIGIVDLNCTATAYD